MLLFGQISVTIKGPSQTGWVFIELLLRMKTKEPTEYENGTLFLFLDERDLSALFLELS